MLSFSKLYFQSLHRILDRGRILLFLDESEGSVGFKVLIGTRAFDLEEVKLT